MPSFLQLIDATGNVINGSNPSQVQQAQLTDANDEVRANLYVQSNGVWVPRRWPNLIETHQNLTLANNGTSNMISSASGGGGVFRIHEVQLFSTIGGVFSLFDGAPSTTLIGRIGIAANTSVTKDFKGLEQVSAGNALVIRNDTGQTAAITAIIDIEVIT